MTSPSLIKDFLEHYSLEKQNAIQKSGFFAFASIAAFLIFLHFPFYGYDIYEQVEDRIDYSYCAKDGSFNLHCGVQLYKDELRNIADWQSSSPQVFWLGNVINFLLSFALCAGLATLWLVVFKSSGAPSPILPKHKLVLLLIFFFVLLVAALVALELQLWSARSQLTVIARNVEATQFNIVEQSTGERIESTISELDRKLEDLDRKLDALDQRADIIKSTVDMIYIKE